MSKNFSVVGLVTSVRFELTKAGSTPPRITGAGGQAVDYTVVRPIVKQNRHDRFFLIESLNNIFYLKGGKTYG